MHVTRTAVLALLAVVACAACAPSLPPPVVVADGVTLRSDLPYAFDDDLPRNIARYRDAVATDLGAPTGRPVDVALFAQLADAERACSANAFETAACAEGDLAISTVPIDAHELVHAFTLPFGDPPAVFSEGLADVYSCRLPFSVGPHAILADAVVSSRVFDDAAAHELPAMAHGVYVSSASFVGYLLDTYGAPAFFAFFRRASSETDMPTLDALATETMGTTISGALAAWGALPTERTFTRCRRLLECSAPEMPLGTRVDVTLTRGLSRVSATQAGALRTLRVDAPTLVQVRMEAAGIWFELASCDRGTVALNGLDASLAGGSVTLQPGRYYLWATGTLADGASTAPASLEVDAR